MLSRRSSTKHSFHLESTLEDPLHPEMLFGLSIPSYIVLHDVGSRSRQDNTNSSFAVYNIEVTTKYTRYRLGKRFSDFHRLKLDLEQQNITPTCEFPRKTWFKSTKESLLEDRRAQLETYIKEALSLTYGTSCLTLLAFFEYTKYNTIR